MSRRSAGGEKSFDGPSTKPTLQDREDYISRAQRKRKREEDAGRTDPPKSSVLSRLGPRSSEGSSSSSGSGVSNAATAGKTHEDTRPDAIVTLVMRGDAFVCGALVLGHSLRQSKTRHRTACMVTKDVSPPAVGALRLYFDDVILIDYISSGDQRLKLGHDKNIFRETQEENLDRYRQWFPVGFTKYRAVELTQYRKILFLDADMIIVKNCDHLLDMRAPAGNLASWSNHNHGRKVPIEVMERLQHRHCIRGCTWVVETSERDFKGLVDMVANYERDTAHIETMGGPLELVLTRYYFNEWSHIHRGYCAPEWKCEKMEIGPSQFHIADFLGPHKPWDSPEDYPDFKRFDDHAVQILREHPRETYQFFKGMLRKSAVCDIVAKIEREEADKEKDKEEGGAKAREESNECEKEKESEKEATVSAAQ